MASHHTSPVPATLLALLAGLALTGCDTRGAASTVPGAMLVHEPDLRTPKKAASAPPPIQGGTLLALDDGDHVVVGDTDRHRLLGVSIKQGEVLFERDLGAGVLPGRMAADAAGRVHVVLRGAGELLTLDPTSGEELRRAQVCPEPRGLAYEPTADALHLACADGTLWSYGAGSGEVLGKLFVAPDLRDVALAGSGSLWVSTFRKARVFHVAADGSVSVAPALPSAVRFSFDSNGDDGTRHMVARAAWRMISRPDGTALVVHQRASQDEVEIEPHVDHVPDVHRATTVREPLAELNAGSNSYGGGVPTFDDPGPALTCDSIVHSALTRLSPNGSVGTTASLPDVILPVDVALSPNGAQAAVVSAGVFDQGTPKAHVVTPELGDGPTTASFVRDAVDAGTDGGLDDCPECGGSGSVQVVLTNRMRSDDPIQDDCLQGVSSVGIPEPAVSVSFMQSTTLLLLVQTRQPSRLYVVYANSGDVRGRIELGGESVADTGHDLFHRDSGSGLACASCHLEGQEDGHTWLFSELGARRTQPLNVQLRGTEPFHWDGAMDGLGAIMTTVFVGRMGGAPQSPERLDALTDWVEDLHPPAPVRSANDPAAKRGKALFESAEVGCAVCHSGKKLTNNQSVDVGTSDGEPLQVPSLRGVARRLPLMHDGCAATLTERFDPACGGGDEHGHTSQLSEDEIADLVAYLETL